MRRLLTLMPAMLAALAMSAAPALAGEDDDDGNSPPSSAPAPDVPNSANLRSSSQGCVNGSHAKAWVNGSNIERVTFFVDGKRVETASRPDAAGRYGFSMACTRLSVGAHRARAVVSFTGGANRTLRFQITRTRRTSARFTG